MMLYDGKCNMFQVRGILSCCLMLGLFGTVASSHAGRYTVSYSGGEIYIIGPLGSEWFDNYLMDGDTYEGSGSSSEPPPFLMAGPGSVDCYGELTATLTWVPDYVGEPPPPVVLYRETCTASWGGDTGSANNGLGFAAVTAQDGYSGTSTGVRYAVKTNPGSQFEVKCSPSASASLSSNSQSSHLAAGASVRYKVEVAPIEIELTGGLPSAPGTEYLIGQKCTGSVVSPWITTNGLVNESRTWSVSGGDPFKKFDTSWHIPGAQVSKGFRVDLSSTDLQAMGLACHFAKPEAEITVNCSVHLAVPSGAKPEAGLTVQLQTETSSIPPTIGQVVVTKGTVRIPSSNAVIHLDDQDPAAPTRGIIWSASVTTPSAYEITTAPDAHGRYGSWQWVQIITLGSTRVVNGVTQEEVFEKTEEGQTIRYKRALDSSYPYTPGWAADGSTGTAEDPPSVPLELIATSYNVRDDFEDTLMYKPPGAGSDWVPLKLMTWYWGGIATKSGTSWALSSPVHDYQLGSTNFPAHPNWDRYGFNTLLQWRTP